MVGVQHSYSDKVGDDMKVKIREGMARKVCQVDRSQWEGLTDADKEYYFSRADDYLEYLHSEGVVLLKQGQGFPDNALVGSAVESLIKEGE